MSVCVCEIDKRETESENKTQMQERHTHSQQRTHIVVAIYHVESLHVPAACKSRLRAVFLLSLLSAVW